MPQLLKDFVDHPRSVGETYVGHWQTAMSFALTLLALAVACVVHAFVPGLFKHTASRTVDEMHRRMVTRRDGARAAQQAPTS